MQNSSCSGSIMYKGTSYDKRLTCECAKTASTGDEVRNKTAKK